MSKRIAFLWTNNSFKDNGGIYHFVRGLAQFAKKHDWYIDIILDKMGSPAKWKYASKEFEELGVRVLSPKQPLPDGISSYYSFTEGLNAVELANLQMSLFESMQNVIYDYILCCPLWTSIIPYISCLDIPVIYYSHSVGSINGDFDKYDFAHIERFAEMFHSNCIVGTQTAYNAKIMTDRGLKNVIELPLPFPDMEMMKPVKMEKSGILTVATTEPRKGFDVFFDLIKQTGFPAKVMTSTASAKKFEEMFKQAGIKDYEIKHNIVGKEKRDFFASSKIFFSPSTGESFGYAFAEAIPHTHAVAFDYDWTKNFDTKFCHIIPKKGHVQYITNLYNSNPPIGIENSKYIEDMQQLSEDKWVELIESELDADLNKKFMSSFIDKYRNFWISELCELDNKVNLNVDHWIPLINRKNSGQAQIVHTGDGTWFTLDGVPPKERQSASTFDALFTF